MPLRPIQLGPGCLLLMSPSPQHLMFPLLQSGIVGASNWSVETLWKPALILSTPIISITCVTTASSRPIRAVSWSPHSTTVSLWMSYSGTVSGLLLQLRIYCGFVKHCIIIIWYSTRLYKSWTCLRGNTSLPVRNTLAGPLHMVCPAVPYLTTLTPPPPLLPPPTVVPQSPPHPTMLTYLQGPPSITLQRAYRSSRFSSTSSRRSKLWTWAGLHKHPSGALPVTSTGTYPLFLSFRHFFANLHCSKHYAV